MGSQVPRRRRLKHGRHNPRRLIEALLHLIKLLWCDAHKLQNANLCLMAKVKTESLEKIARGFLLG